MMIQSMGVTGLRSRRGRMAEKTPEAATVLTTLRPGVARTITRDAQQPRRAAPERRNRLTRRLLPMLGIAAAALIVGLILGAGHVPAEQKLAERFATAWDKGDYGAMYDLLSDDARHRVSPAAFAAAYRPAAATATVVSVTADKAPDPQDGTVALPVRVRTRVWGPIAGIVKLPFAGDGDSARVDWKRNLVFPDLGPGEHLTRKTELGERGDILARNGSTLATGTAGTPAFPEATGLVGEIGVPGPMLRASLRPLGFPPDA